MKYKNKLIISIGIVTILTIIIVSATYAYWSWRVEDKDETEVSFEVIGTGLSAHIEGNGTEEITNLIPSSCGSANTLKKEVIITYQNETERTATILSTLKITSLTLKNTSLELNDEQLQKLRYALTTSPDSCDTNIALDLDGNEVNGNFSSLGLNGNNIDLPKNLFSHTFLSNGNMQNEESKKYYLWIWLDESYEYQSVGDENKDPMQGLKFVIEWSGSITQNEN